MAGLKLILLFIGGFIGAFIFSMIGQKFDTGEKGVLKGSFFLVGLIVGIFVMKLIMGW